MPGTDHTDFNAAHIRRWGLLFRSENARDGYREHLLRWPIDGIPRVLEFETREEARRYKREKYGYITRRKDLQREPHGWMAVKVVKLTSRTITYE